MQREFDRFRARDRVDGWAVLKKRRERWEVLDRIRVEWVRRRHRRRRGFWRHSNGSIRASR